MRSILLGEKVADIERVYGEESLHFLEQNADLNPQKIYCKADVVANFEQFSEVENIFSTWHMPVFTEEEIKTFFPSLKTVYYAAGTVKQFAEPFLKCGVNVISAWAANAIPVAEYTVAQILLANKGFFSTSRIVKSSSWRDAATLDKKYPGNFGVKVGLLGAGMVGRAVIERLRPFPLKVMVFDPFLSEEKAASLNVEKASLETIFQECEVVSNHLANKPETVGMLHRVHFESMKPYATFINTGRGAQVVEEDLVKVLTERPDLTAILDVTYPEPPVEGHPFYTLENCILTPHIAGSIGLEVHRMAEYMVEAYRKEESGIPSEYRVSLEMMKTMA